MKKTYVTTMPDHIGAFLKASRCFAALDLNITRVSYNKAVDSHTLFIDAEGSPEQLAMADEQLAQIGYLQSSEYDQRILLLEFALRDVPGSVLPVLELIQDFDFNISYISSQENGTDRQFFKMGLLVDDEQDISAFLVRAEELCEVRVIHYDNTEKVYDNSIFYHSFVSGIAKSIGLSAEMRENLLIHTNLAMQTLDEQGLSPYRTFDSIGRFAEMLASYRGKAFSPRITTHRLTEVTELTLIEPPCGSNTAILRSGDQTLMIDTGYACYRAEMEAVFRDLLPDYDRMDKTVLITHADVDHCGLLPLFDRVLASRKSADCLRAEYERQYGFRERNALHRPYINICKTLTGYRPPEPEKVVALWGDSKEQHVPLQQIGMFDFGDLHFEVYEGQGGHLPGEIVLIDYEHRIAFTGDVYVNVHGFTEEQARYNQYAPILMTSVDTNPLICALERKAIFQRLGAGQWQIFGAHGCKVDYSVEHHQ